MRRLTNRTRIARVLFAELQSRAGYTWEQLNARYRSNQTGRFVAEKTIIAEAERYHEQVVAPNIERITERMVNGNMTVSQWQTAMQREIKDAHIISVQAGRGGKKATTQTDYGRQGGRLKFEYRQLDQFAAEIAEKQGTLNELSPAQIKARAQLYSGGSRTAYYDGQTAAQVGAGLKEERRVLGVADHCSPCTGFAAQGWVPISTLPEPGTECEGMHNCKCRKEYR